MLEGKNKELIFIVVSVSIFLMIILVAGYFWKWLNALYYLNDKKRDIGSSCANDGRYY